MLMIPFEYPWVQELVEESRRQAEDLDVLFQLIGELAAGSTDLRGSPGLRAFLDASNSARQSELLGQTEKLLAQGQEPAVLRRLRELTSGTWDEVYALFGRWPDMTAAEKQRWARRLLYRQAVRSGSELTKRQEV